MKNITPEEIHEQRQARAIRYHDVFAKSESGRLIFQEWVEDVLHNIPSPDASERAVGMMDGKRELIKMIRTQLYIATGEKHE